MAEMNVELLREKLYTAAKALFRISETCVEVSKMHISETDALDKIRNYLYDTDVIGSRYRVDKLIEECTVPAISDWFREYLDTKIQTTLETSFPSVCDGCPSNPKNGGSGICNCTLPYMQNPVMYSTGDPCMANNIDGHVYFVNNMDDLKSNACSADRIAKAVERTKKYIKE